jgi:hypothetical protein
MPYRSTGMSFRRVESWTLNALCCETSSAEPSYGRPDEMMSTGCGDAWAMVRRDGRGCDVDGRARPCQGWAPFLWMAGTGYPLTPRDSCAACAARWRSSRETVLARAGVLNESRYRGVAVWTSPARVALVKMLCCRRGALAGAPSLSLEVSDPLVSTCLYPGPDATRPCRLEVHYK